MLKHEQIQWNGPITSCNNAKKDVPAVLMCW